MGRALIAINRVSSLIVEMDSAAGLQRWLGSSASARICSKPWWSKCGAPADQKQAGRDEFTFARAMQRIPPLQRHSVPPLAVGSNLGL